MNSVIASNIRHLRAYRAWTQEHLAEAAGITVRTVQRAEGRQGMTAETLTAIAGAFDVSIEELRLDAAAILAAHIGVAKEELTEERLKAWREQQRKEFEEQYYTVPMTRITTPADFSALSGVFALRMQVVSGSEEGQDVAAELRQYLQDYIDLQDDVGPVGLRDMDRGAYELVQRLETLGCAASIGRFEEPLRFRDGSQATWPVACVVVALGEDLRAFAAVKRNSAVKLG
jgi:transcriptional regulator with XRE-family HTH domain